jgi:hypothetical protein
MPGPDTVLAKKWRIRGQNKDETKRSEVEINRLGSKRLVVGCCFRNEDVRV